MYGYWIATERHKSHIAHLAIVKHEKTSVWLHVIQQYFGLRYLFIGNQIEFINLLCPSVINFTERYSVS